MPNVDPRYQRQVLFPGLGETGQAALAAAHVLVVGCGATGSVIASTLARAGVGHLRLVDRDFVELSNLPRQVLYDEDDVRGRAPKAVAAAAKLARTNSTIRIEPVVSDVNPDNIEELLEGVGLVLDGTDNFETRYLVNDACVKHDVPWIYGGAVASYGATFTLRPHVTACFRCLFPHAPPPGTLPTCDTAGVIGPIVNVVGSLVASEALKLLTSSPSLNPNLVQIDLWDNAFDAFEISRRLDCPCCVRGEFEYLEASGEATAHLCGRNAVQVRPARRATPPTLDLGALAARLAPLGRVAQNEYLIQFGVDEYDLTIFADGRAIVKGTEDEAAARTLYARYVGS